MSDPYGTFDKAPSTDSNDIVEENKRNQWSLVKVLSILALIGGAATIAVLARSYTQTTPKPTQLSATENIPDNNPATAPATPVSTETVNPSGQPTSSAAASTVNPNFIFVLADDMGWNSMGYENYDLTYASPVLTALAREGIIMNNYYSQEVCTPARAALLTGRLPLRMGMQYGVLGADQVWGVDLDETLIAEVLKDGGYSTYAIGKWNLGHYAPQYLPTARGFDNHIGYMDGQNYYWSKLNVGYTDYYDFMYSDTECYDLYNGTDMTNYSTYIYTDKALLTIDLHDFSQGPMYMYLAAQAVHDPFTDYDSHDDGLTADYVGTTRYTEVEDDIVGDRRQQYAMSLMLLDDQVGEIISALKEVGQWDNTYLIFASDNGGCYLNGGRNGPLRGTKGTLWEGGTKVDSFIYSPMFAESVRGTIYNGLFHVTDWFPTILSLAGLNYTAPDGYELDGVDQSTAMIEGVEANERTYILYNIMTNVEGKNYDIYFNSTVAVRNNRYKLIHAYNNSDYSEWWDYATALDDDAIDVSSTCSQPNSLTGDYHYFLFDLVNDPYEETNLYYESGYDEVKTELYAIITKYLEVTEEDSESESTDSSALTYWSDNGGWIQPWYSASDIDDDSVSTYPSKCTRDSLYSPDNADE